MRRGGERQRIRRDNARGWKKVAQGLLVEIYGDQTPPSQETAQRVVLDALRALGSSALQHRPAPGMGQTVHGVKDGVTVTGVTHRDVLYHALAVPDRERLEP